MRLRILLLTALIGIWGANPGQSGELRQRIEFSLDDLTFSVSEGYDVVYLQGCEVTNQVGEPQLPVKLVQMVVPSGSEIKEVVVVSSKSEFLPGRYEILPAQPPRILSLGPGPFPVAEPRDQVYKQREEYPHRIAECTGGGFLAGYQLVNVLICPVRYLPAEKKIRFYSELELSIRWSPGGREALPVGKRTPAARQTYSSMLERVVSNPQGMGLNLRPQEIAKSMLGPGDYEYVIITDITFVTSFQPLADWKTQKGIPTKIVNLGWVCSHYSGTDSAEQIRNFIKDAYQNWGTLWVLLGGDTNVIPRRIAWAFDCEAGIASDENFIPCDLYFSDLDGDWNANGNLIHGEVDDSIDLYPDVFVGRASCSSAGEVQAWVNKVITYEKNPPVDYPTKMLFLAEILWSNPYTNSALSKELIDQKYVPPQFDPITKLYEDLGNENWSTTMTALNDGQNIVNHDGHCWYTVMGVGSGSLNHSDMDNLTNHPRNSILLSIGCWPAAIDYDCIAEHFVNNSNGGGVAFVGNSRYGWGSPGNPKYGYSDRFDQQFYASLFERNVYHIGATVADMKSFYVPFSRQENVYRWCQYQINLLGDPEMPIWTDTPGSMMVHHPDTVIAGSTRFPVTVLKGSGDSQPVPEALVCLMKGEELYQRGLTDQQGQIVFDVSPSTPGALLVTVTAHDFLHHADSAWVISGGGYVLYDGHSLDDASTGNGDGLPNPGETIDLSVSLKNWGTEIVYNVYAVMHSGDPYVTLIDSIQHFGTMDPGEIADGFGPYRFGIHPDCPNGHVIYFDLDIAEGYGVSWTSTAAVTVYTPALVYRSYSVDDVSGGNGNGEPEPGETVNLQVNLKNQGMQSAGDVTGILSCADPYIHITDSTGSFGDIDPGVIWTADFRVHLLFTCPSTYYPHLHLRTETSEGYSFQDDFILWIGEGGFKDDMESGSGLWTHGGTGDLWHLSGNRKHSGDYSWYNGIEGSWYFDDGTRSWLESAPLVVEPESYLSFWLWYDVTNYGVDGVHVQIVDQSTGLPDTLDFIGTGGALDSLLNTGNNWLEYSYDLSHIPPGTSVRVRFGFASDYDDTHDGEGFYIDDVSVGPRSSTWLPGDVTGDEVVDVGDAIFLLNYLFKGGPAPDPFERGDVTQDEEIDLSDTIYLLNYLYKGGPAPL